MSKMDIKNPFITASAASIAYFIIIIILKYFLQETVDLQSALLVAIVFGIVIFVLHQFLKRRYAG